MGWGLTQRFVFYNQRYTIFGPSALYVMLCFANFLGGMGRRSLVVFQSRKVGFFLIFQGIIFLAVWDGVVGERGGYIFFLSFLLL